MYKSLFALAFTLVLSLQASTAQPQSNADTPIAIMGATVVDGTGASPQPLNVLIQGNRITALAPKIELPPNTRVIKAEGMTLLPGLFDLHTHLPYASGGGVNGDWPKNLKAYLYCGVTSVVDFGTYPETFEPMRRLIKDGVVLAPRLHLAARISTPGGHGAEGGRGDFFTQEVTSPREARTAVQRVLPYQPDAIKVFTDGWRYGAAPDMTSMNEDTLAALVEEAHKNNLEVLTHTVSLDKAKIAARAGVDVIAHGIGDKPADDELIKLMKEKGTAYAPTLAVYEPRARDILTPLLAATLDAAAQRGMNPPLIPPQNPPLAPRAGSAENGDPPRQRRWRILQANTAALRNAGITFGVGTDAGVTGTHHGWATLRELQLLVAGGLTPLEAIAAATSKAAKALHVDNERGSIALGKLADLVLIAGKPHENIKDIEHISRVFLNGRELDRERMAKDIGTIERTPLPARPAVELLDDFERAPEQSDIRSQIDTLWLNSSDAGTDASKVLFGRIKRSANDHALSLTTRMAEKERPYARVNLPLSRGAVEPVDVRAFRGIRFDVRGAGDYRLLISTYNTRSNASFHAPFQASPNWRTVSLEFSTFQAESALKWTGADLLMLSFEVSRTASKFGWMELDNVRFYR